MTRGIWLLGALLLMPLASTASDKVTVALASNFIQAAREIADAFQATTGNQVQFSVSSSGKLYAQISHGAPFDVFLSADAERPTLLEESGLVVPGTRRTYATGRLTLGPQGVLLDGKPITAEGIDIDQLPAGRSAGTGSDRI